MLPNPLHPAVVHLPIALAVLMPAIALVALLAIRRGAAATRTWAGVVLLQGLLLGSGWLAVETGEREEEQVERFVPEARIEEHEEAGERFRNVAAGALVVSALGLLAGRAGGAARIATVAAGVAVLLAGVSVGHSGGELVYRHGAAEAYLPKTKSTLPAPGGAAERPGDE
jgi:uncharacterized membrane protein